MNIWIKKTTALLSSALLLAPAPLLAQAQPKPATAATKAANQAVLKALPFNDLEFGGNGQIYGMVERQNTPANLPLRRRVRLHRSRDGLLVRETWSQADGRYAFTHISTAYEYDTIAWDHDMSYRSVMANNLKPEVMP